MKKPRKVKRVERNTMEIRNLTRHTVTPPTFSFKDKKKAANKKACRKRNYERDRD